MNSASDEPFQDFESVVTLFSAEEHSVLCEDHKT